ncbi:MAG: acyltransferase [Bacteroidetes bacterium]|nr:acyltransferase [Bacteroidota bacterium]
MTTDTTQRIYFKNLDILRFFAAYMIVILHSYFGWQTQFGNPNFIKTMTPYRTEKLETLFGNFCSGVDIFFVISGFLITYLLLAEKDKMGKVDVVKFWIRRAFRIWPLYFLILLIGPLLTYFYGEQEPGYLYHFFFAGNFDILYNGTKSVATDHLWSICIEEHFYLICPLLVAFIPLKRLPEVLLSIVALTILFRAYLATQVPMYGSAVYVHTLSRIDVLAIGSLFGYLAYNKRISFNHNAAIRLLVYGIFIFMFVTEKYTDTSTFFNATIKKYFYVSVMVYWVGNFMFNPKVFFPITQTNIFHHFGKVSYGMYMFNPIIIFIVLKAFDKFHITNYLLYVALVNATLAAVCYVSYKFYEIPFLALKEKYSVVKSGDEVKIATDSGETITPEVTPEIIPVNVSDKPTE